jgi:hypothetical protein
MDPRTQGGERRQSRMEGLMRRAVLTIIAMLAATSAHCEDPSGSSATWGEPVNGIRMALIRERDEQSASGPVQLCVLVENVGEVGDPPISIPCGGIFDGVGLRFYVQSADAEGRWGEARVCDPPPVDHRADCDIAPGDTRGHRIDLSWLGYVDGLSEAKPGRYRVIADYTPDRTQPNHGLARWIGKRLTSAAIEVTIRAR